MIEYDVSDNLLEYDITICEECDEEMDVYYDSPDTGRDGFRCPLCGWSFDI